MTLYKVLKVSLPYDINSSIHYYQQKTGPWRIYIHRHLNRKITRPDPTSSSPPAWFGSGTRFHFVCSKCNAQSILHQKSLSFYSRCIILACILEPTLHNLPACLGQVAFCSGSNTMTMSTSCQTPFSFPTSRSINITIIPLIHLTLILGQLEFICNWSNAMSALLSLSLPQIPSPSIYNKFSKDLSLGISRIEI